MALSQALPKRKLSGSRYRTSRKKKHFELGGTPAFTKLDKPRRVVKRVMGAHLKIKSLAIDYANLYDPKTKSYSKTAIKTITDNPANRNFVRRNIITKGAILETEKGKAKVTSRPGQTGTVNAVLISE